MITLKTKCWETQVRTHDFIKIAGENSYGLIVIDHAIKKGNKCPCAIKSDSRPSNRIRLAFVRVWHIFWPSVCTSKIVPRIVDMGGGLWWIFRGIPLNSISSTLRCRATHVGNEREDGSFFFFYLRTSNELVSMMGLICNGRPDFRRWNFIET